MNFLDEILSPLDRKTFLEQYWTRRFLHLRGTEGRFAYLLPWEELNSILENSSLAPPRLRLVKDGKSIDPAAYMDRLGHHPSIDSGGFAAALAQGATLVVDSVNQLSPRIGQLSGDVQDALRANTLVNLYAGWRTQNGFDLHWDSQETIILQISGRKRWKVYAPTREHPLRDDVEIAAQPSAPPVWDDVLEDGDLLYMPRGWWHVAHPLDEPSLHLTVTIVPPLGTDLLQWLLDALRKDAAVRAPLPSHADGQARAAYLAHIRRLLTQACSADFLGAYEQEYESRLRTRFRSNLPAAPAAQRQAPGVDTQVRLASSHALLIREDESGLFFTLKDRRWTCHRESAPALAMLSHRESIPVERLTACLKDSKAIARLRMLLSAMAIAGVITLESPEGSASTTPVGTS